MTLHDSYPTYIPCLPRSPLQEADTEKGINLDGKSKTFWGAKRGSGRLWRFRGGLKSDKSGPSRLPVLG